MCTIHMNIKKTINLILLVLMAEKLTKLLTESILVIKIFISLMTWFIFKLKQSLFKNNFLSSEVFKLFCLDFLGFLSD